MWVFLIATCLAQGIFGLEELITSEETLAEHAVNPEVYMNVVSNNFDTCAFNSYKI